MPYISDDKQFDTLEEMHEYYKSQEPWYEKAWNFVYLPVYRFFYWGIWDKIKPSNFKHWYQRARYGYSYRDCWSIDYHLSDIIPKMIREMRKDLNGCPGEIVEKWNGGKTDNDMTMAMLEWETVLYKIADAFELEHEILDGVLYDCKDEESENKMRELMKKEGCFEGCRIMTQEEKDLRDEGWKYFRKYFYNLWD